MPQPQGADVYRLAAGEEMALAVNVHVDDGTADKLIRNKRDGQVVRSVTAVMFYDEGSQHPGSVRIELPSGEIVGWVTRGDQKLAGKVLDAVSKARRRRDRNHPLVLEVSAQIVGARSKEGVEIDSVTIPIASPVEATPLSK